jgi:hypothetical protein
VAPLGSMDLQILRVPPVTLLDLEYRGGFMRTAPLPLLRQASCRTLLESRSRVGGAMVAWATSLAVKIAVTSDDAPAEARTIRFRWLRRGHRQVGPE